MKRFLRNLALVALLCVPWVTQGQQTLPYSQDFSGSSLPDGWVSVGSGSLSIDNSTLKFSGATSNVVALPEFSVTNGYYLTVTFEVKAEGNYSSCNAFDWGYVTDIADASTFESMGTVYYSAVLSYTQKTMELMSVPAGARAALRARPTSGSYYWFVDNVEVTESPLPTCFKVTDVNVTNVTNSSAKLNWTIPQGQTASYMIYNGSTYVLTTEGGADHASVPGLTANTTYSEFKIKANCGNDDYSDFATVPSFTTSCNPILTSSLPYNEGFEDYTGTSYSATTGVVPDCWSAYATGSVKPHVIGGTGSYIYVHNGTKALTFYGSGYCYATLPAFEAALNTLQISFWYQQENANNGTLTLGYITDGDVNMSTFTPIVSYDGVSTMTQAPTTYLNEVPATATRLVFRWYYSSQYSCCIDDIEIKEMSACMPVTNLIAPEANITTTSITLTWNDNNNSSATYIITDGEDVEIPAAQLDGLTTTGVTITGLTANTSYSFKVKADCGGGEYSDAVSVNARTACGAEAIPFNENFDSYTASTYSTAVVPDCWIFSPEPTGYYYTSIYNEYPYSGTLNLRFYSYYKANSVVVLPEMAAATNTLQVRFYHRPYSTSYGTMQVGYVTDIEDTTTFVNLKTLARTSTTYAPEEITFEAAPAGSRIAFRYIGSTYSTNYKWYIDDITVETIPICKNVTAPTVPSANITSNSATLSWTDTRNEGATYTVYNKATEPATALGTTDAGVTTINLTDLTANTTYNQLVVVANCSDNEHSGEVSVPSFTTKRNECAITAVTIATPVGVTRGDVVIDAVNHSVTIPVYYLTTEEIAALTGSISKSTGATIYAYNTETSDWTTQISSLVGIRDNLAMNMPYTVRVKAEDPAVYADWTITLLGEDCSTPRNLTFAAERTRLTANWVNADPTAENYQVVISPSELDAAALDATEKTAVNGAKTYTFTGLLRETPYYVYVRTNCGNDIYSSWADGTVTTKGLNFCEDVLVADGSDYHTNVPLDFYNTDASGTHKAQFLYPASEISSLTGTIDGIKFYHRANQSKTLSATTWYVKVGTTSETTLEGGFSEASLTEVYSGNLVIASGVISFDFETPFVYTDGNLIVELSCTGASGNWFNDGGNGFYGTDGIGSTYSTATNYTNFLPKTTFHHCANIEACPAVAAIEVNDITETGAIVAWGASTGDYVSGYQVIKSDIELDAATLDAYTGPYAYEGPALTCALSGLTAYTEYYIYVRANCGAPDNVSSTWQSTTFRTLSACGVVADLAIEQTSKTTVVATWTKTKEAQANNFNYILSTTEYDVETQGDILNGLPKTGSALTALTVALNISPATHYYFYVQNDCGNEGLSPWKSVDFTTYDAMPAVVNITATQITHTAIAAIWQKNVAQFADESAWQVAVVAHGAPEPTSWTVVNDTHYTFIGLTPETSYDLYVRPYQPNPEAFGTAAHLEDVTTTAFPATCETVADGTLSTTYVPVYGNWYDNPQRTQSIYPASMLTELVGKTLTSMKYFVSSTSSYQPSEWFTGSYTNTQFNVTLTITEQSSFETAAWDMTPATTVYTGQMGNDGVIAFDEPFVYNGGNLLVTFNMPTRAEYKDVKFDAIDATNGSVYKYGTWSSIDNATPNKDNHLPKVQFCYAVAPNACMDITEITVSDVTTTSANVSWMPGNTEVDWIYKLLDAELPEPTAPDYFFTTTPNVSYNNSLQTDHDYRFWVRPVIDNEPCGNWKSVAFHTTATCGMPTVLPADGITVSTATLHALAHPTIGTASTYTFRYWKAGDEENKTLVNPTAENTANITNLTPNTTYWYDVMVSCTGEAGDSRWSEPKSFLTDYQNFTLPYTTDFASGRDNEWRMVSGAYDNRWYIGEAAGNPARGMYISNDGGEHNTYNGDDGNCVVYAYAAFNNFEATKQYTVEFDWKNKGEGSYSAYDILRAWIVSDDVTLTASANFPSGMSGTTGNPTGWITLDNSTPMYWKDEWQHKKAYVTVPADGAYKIVFMWRQDGSGGTNPPAAIDNVSIVESEKYDITLNVTKTSENVSMGADPTAEVNDEPLTSLTDIYEHTEVKLTAGDPIYGYEFVNWTDNNGIVKGSGRYVYLTLMSDTVLNANYDSTSFTITAATANPTFGSANGTATVKFNQPVTLTAEPNTGFRFVNWINSHDVVCGTEASFTVNAYRDSTFTATFDTNVYNVTANVNNTAMGSVSGPATVKHFKNADYEATANTGYHFVNWTNLAGTELGAEAVLNIAPVSDTTVIANFAVNTYALTVNVAAECTGMGTVAGSNPAAEHFQNYQISATPATGYHFVQWQDGNNDNPRTVTLTAAATYTATFDTNVYNVTANVNNTAMGSVSGPATVKHFKNADYEATANTGYHFVNWTNLAGTELGAEAVLNIAPVSDTTVIANFAVNTYALTVNVAAECTGMGTVAGSNPAAEHFQNYQISATPATGYHFVQWQDGNSENPRTVTLTAAATYTASFDTNVYVLTVVSGNETMGSASGSVAAAKHFVNYEISAEANYGYHFTGWNDNNTDNPRTVTLTESKTYTANFTYNSYTVSGTPNNSEWGSVSGSATVNYQSDVTLTATPNYGYVFVNWKEADTVYSTQNPVAVEALSNRSLTAVFAKDQFTVNAAVAAGCESMGTVAPATTTAEYMTPVTLTATPAEGYHLVSWSNGATTEQITVLADSNRNLTATFAINLYDITVNYDATRGTVTDAQSSTVTSGTVFTGVAHGTVLNFTANVNEGSRFAGWNDGAATVTTESIAYTATATRTLTASFIDAGNFQVTLNYNNVMGTVSGAGEHHADSDVTITATPNYGYHFVAWMHGETIVSNNASYTFTMPTHDTSFTAVFDVNQYTLTVASVDTNRGTVSGTATVNYLTNVPVNATNKYGYHFTHWYGNGINDTVATTANATIQVLRDSAVTANFDFNQYTVTAVSADVNTGSVSGTATVNYLSNVTLIATPAAGYHFVKWTNEAGAEVSTNAEYEVQATENVTYTANFATTPAQLAWNAEAFTGYTLIDFNNWAPILQNPNNVEVRYGVVEDSILVNAETGVIGAPATYGNVVTTTGTYHIYAVHETSQQYYYDSVTYTLTVENGTLIALMKNISAGGAVSFPDYTQEAALTYRYVDENMMAFIAHGTTVRAEATPATGFNFVEWRSGNNVAGYDSLSTNNPVTYTVPDEEASGLMAIFDTIVYNVTVVANPVEGSVEGPATVKHFLSGTYTATATPCYHFVNWTNADNTVVLGTEPTLTIAAVSDSTIKANFALNVYTGDTTVNVCDEFTWHDSTYTVTPEVAPTYVYKTANNCDSTVTLHLTIRHSNTGDTTAVACNSFTWYGTTYNTTPAVAPTHVFTNVAGCDSTVTLHLTVNYSNTGDTTAVACNSFTWYGTTYNTTPAVAPTHVFTNVADCDSTVTLHLTVNHSNTGDTTAVACNSFTWYGTTYNTTPAVAPTHVFTNVAGCDSTVTLHLTVNHSNTGDTTAVVCNSFTWYGTTYTSTPAVAPTHVFTNVAGCDSTVTLHLTVNHSNTGDTTAVACDSLTWYGVTYTSTPAVAPTHVLTNVAGCDSTVTLHLTINNSQTVTIDPITNCDSVLWNNTWYYQSGEQSFTTTGANGCDSTTIVMLTINNSQTVVLDPVVAYDSFEWNGVVYTESGELSFTTEGANGCDSTTIVMLTINHYDSITVILTVNDATMGTTDPEAGTYRFYPGETVSATATANEGYRFLGWVVSYGSYSDTISRDAEVSYEFVAAMAGQTFTVEAVFAENVGIKTVDYSNINIFSADSKVYVKGAEGMTIYIYDVNGRCMARRANAAETETFTLDVTGVVLVKAGNAPAKRVLLVR